jgi:AraC family transcriptional regulator of adaptative response / DNA-3-methyladenine glycosylase II
VVRALRLIQEGALDRTSAEEFASRLGVGERQLRRLFVEHVGAPPSGFAQLRRVHLAKQLIHETDLPMIEIAYASGYRSLRRFNESFRQMFGRAPATLRGRPVSGGRLSIRLAYAPPYDWDAMVGTLARRAIAGVERVDQNAYRRTMDVGGVPGAIRVTRAGEGYLRADLEFSKLDALPRIVAQVRSLFDLAADPLVLAEHFQDVPALAAPARARPGLRVPGHWDTFELVVRTILGERLTRTASNAPLHEFVLAFGEPAPNSGDGLTHYFPRLERLRHRDLSVVSITAGQATAIASYAEAALRDPTPMTSFTPIEETIDWLSALPGFDREIAVSIATRLAEPTNDVSGLSADDVARIEASRPWRAYAALHLFGAGEPDVGGAFQNAA